MSSIQSKLATLRKEMNSALIERTEEIDLVLASLVSGHHPLLVGEPGTGKSLLGRSIAKAVSGRQQEILLSKYTDPAELFGPVSVTAFKNDEYRRITVNTVLDAPLCFLDEIFKASTAILNTLLGVLNERQFRNGNQMLQVPLVMAIAASNEWPHDSETGGKELNALFDRFLLRKVVKGIQSPEGRRKLLTTPKQQLIPNVSVQITSQELEQARLDASQLVIPPDTLYAIEEVIQALAQEGIQPGDRRILWSLDACRASAYLTGAKQVEKDHLEILAHALWIDPREQPAKCAAIVAKIANPLSMKINEILAEVRQVLATVKPGNTQGNFQAMSKLESSAAAIKALGSQAQRVVDAFNYVETHRTGLLSEMLARREL